MELSVVIPVLDEESNIPEVYQRLVAALEEVVSSFEVVFVDDGSTDRSWELISELGRSDPRVKGLRFSRNFGHQMAFTAGLDHVSGDAVVIMDADLQDPPELLPELIARWREGWEVVYAVRSERAGESFFKRVTAAAFYRVLARLTRVDIPLDTGDFRLMGRRAVEAFRQLGECHRLTRGMVAWLGFPQIGVRFARPARRAGETKYHLRRILGLATDGLFSFSRVPLQLATWLGLVVAGLAGILTVVATTARLLGVPVAAATVLAAALVFLGGVQLLALGFLGSYVGRIYEEVKRRPLYLIQETVGELQRLGETE